MKINKSFIQKHWYSIVTLLLVLCCSAFFFLISTRKFHPKNDYSFQRYDIDNPYKQVTNCYNQIDFYRANGHTSSSANILVQFRANENDTFKLFNRDGLLLYSYVSPKFNIQNFGQLGKNIYCIVSSFLLLSETNEHLVFRKIKLPNRLINAIPISDSTLLVLETNSGTASKRAQFRVLNVKTRKFISPEMKATLPEIKKYQTWQEQQLAYDGQFLNVNGTITYTCAHIPYIFVFNNIGQLVKTVETRDKVPAPSIIKFEDYYVFERSKTFNSNMGAFANDNSVFVFSYRISTPGHYIVDKYGLHDGEYQGSFSIANHNNLNNKDIDKIVFLGKNIIIIAKKSVTLLKIIGNSE